MKEVEEYLMEKIRREGTVHMSLIDPESVNVDSASLIALESEENNSVAIMVGGTTLISSEHLDSIVQGVKKVVNIPVVLFPNNITGISKHADAIWFMSLLNSADPYFICGAQVLAAPLVKRFGLEAISLGYIIVGEGGAAAVIGKASPVPYNKPELAVSHALAAKYLGMHFVYLEGGSGVNKPVPPEMVGMVKETVDVPLVVGGGIKTRLQARDTASAGADIIVTSTALEQVDKDQLREKIKDITEGIKEGVSNRYKRERRVDN